MNPQICNKTERSPWKDHAHEGQLASLRESVPLLIIS